MFEMYGFWLNAINNKCSIIYEIYEAVYTIQQDTGIHSYGSNKITLFLFPSNVSFSNSL